MAVLDHVILLVLCQQFDGKETKSKEVRFESNTMITLSHSTFKAYFMYRLKALSLHYKIDVPGFRLATTNS